MLVHAGPHKRLDWRVAAGGFTVWFLLAVTGAMVIQPWRAEVPLSSDFISFWTGAVLIRDGAGPDLYDTGVQARFQAGLRLALTGTEQMRTGEILDPFHSPPVQGLLILPLTVLPVPAAYILFSVGSLVAIWISVALPLRGRPWGATAAVVMLAFAPVADTLLFGQVNAQFVLALSLALMAFRSGLPFLGGVLLGVLWLKPQYAILFPVVFALKGRWRELGGMLSTGAAIAVLSMGLIGFDGAMNYAAMMKEIGGFYAPPDAFIFPQSMVNWRAVITHLVPGVGEETGRVAMMALGVATAGLSFTAWKGKWDSASEGFPLQVLVLLIATILASPHSNFHGMALLLPPLAFVATTTISKGRFGAALTLLITVTYALVLIVWPFKVNSWLLVAPMLSVAVLVTARLVLQGTTAESRGETVG